jgi:predicted DCC family thiol-disulfide oxidoreductase YuxK
MSDGAALVVIYDDDCAICRAAAGWLERHDRHGRLRLEPIADVVAVRGLRLSRADLDVEMHVVDSNGHVERGFRAWRRVAREIPLARSIWPFLYLPGVAPIGALVYRWVAGHRVWLSRALRFDPCDASCARTEMGDN